MKLVFWLEELSLHFSATIRAITQQGHEATVVSQEELQGHRRALGWSVPEFGTESIWVAPDPSEISSIIDGAGPDAIHIVVGLRGAYFQRVIGECSRRGRRLGVYGEGPHPDGWRKPLKWLLYRGLWLMRGRHVDFFLGLGTVSTRWYARCGVPNRRLFPCAYATESPEFGQNPPAAPVGSDPYRLIFVGRCIGIKRLDLALRALARYRGLNWELIVVGDGPKRSDWDGLARELGLRDRVRFLGARPYQETLSYIRDSDLLLLPSTHEGWGAVVNEALMNGVPVLCSDQCGASDLVTNPCRGMVFRAGDEHALMVALGQLLGRGKVQAVQRDQIRSWAACLSGRSVGDYVLRVMAHVYGQGDRPVPPWQGTTPEVGGS